MVYDDCAVLILSCDKYQDLWGPFFKLFWENWPDSPYKIYLGSNLLKFSKDKKVISILSGKDSNWSTSYKKILSQIPEQNIFVWLEDAFVISKINTSVFARCFDFLKKDGVKHIHFKPNPRPDNAVDANFGLYQRGMPYRANSIGFWKKKYLEKVLMDGETGWNFEIMGSYRTSYDDGFYCLLKPAINYAHLVEKGNWIREGLIYCKKNNIDIDFNKRPVARLSIINIIKDQYYKIMLNKPWAIRVKFMNLLRKMLISY